MSEPHQGYTEDKMLNVGYLDVFPCNDAAAIRTEEVCPSVLVDVRTDTDEVAGIELLDLDTPLAKWIAAASAALKAAQMPEINHGVSVSYATSYVTQN